MAAFADDSDHHLKSRARLKCTLLFFNSVCYFKRFFFVLTGFMILFAVGCLPLHDGSGSTFQINH